MTSHVIAYRSLELLFGSHTFHFNCFLEDFNCVFTQIRSLSSVLLQISCTVEHETWGLGVYVEQHKTMTKRSFYFAQNMPGIKCIDVKMIAHFQTNEAVNGFHFLIILNYFCRTSIP